MALHFPFESGGISKRPWRCRSDLDLGFYSCPDEWMDSLVDHSGFLTVRVELDARLGSDSIRDSARICRPPNLRNRAMRKIMLKNKWVQAFIIFWMTTVIWMIVDPSLGQVNATRFAEWIGAGFTLTLIGVFFASIPACIYRIVKGFWPHWTVVLSVPFIAIAGFLSFIGHSNQNMQGQSMGQEAHANTRPERSEGFWFTDEQCTLGVLFPEEPELTTVHHRLGFDMPQARLNRSDGFHFRAECGDYGGAWQEAGETGLGENWVGWLYSFFDAEGFRSPQVSSSITTKDGVLLKVVDGRAYKTLNGSQVIYRVRVLASANSVMIIYAGGLASRFPSIEATNFLESFGVGP